MQRTIEILVATVIIGILIFSNTPHIKNIKNINKEIRTKENLMLIRTAISEYYEQHTDFPLDITSEKFLSQHLGKLPMITLDYPHQGWLYISQTGKIKIMSDHKDTKGQRISSW
ncbi:MAG: type II secretion system protein [bacterium]|nr:type II secretion system protein [bacterium]